ncbi:MAG: hypothetical protein AB7T49_12330 [Oligoflexales bacterium]
MRTKALFFTFILLAGGAIARPGSGGLPPLMVGSAKNGNTVHDVELVSHMAEGAQIPACGTQSANESLGEVSIMNETLVVKSVCQSGELTVIEAQSDDSQVKATGKLEVVDEVAKLSGKISVKAAGSEKTLTLDLVEP